MTMAEESMVWSSRSARGAGIVGGCALLGLGGLGVVVPGLPTTPLLIASAWLFSRSNARLERFVLGLPGVGQMVADHRAGLGVTKRVKITAISMMSLMVVISVTFALDSWWSRLLVIGLGAIGGAYVGWRLPTRA